MNGMEGNKRDGGPVPGTLDRSELTLRLDQAWRILGLNQDLIRAADQKVYLLIVMSTLLVSYVAPISIASCAWAMCKTRCW